MMKSFTFFVFAAFVLVCSFASPVFKKTLNETDSTPLFAPQCGDCGKAYQACCLGYGAKGYPCDCHLTEGGSGTAGTNCGDCGVAYSACCVGFDKDGYPCQCDVM